MKVLFRPDQLQAIEAHGETTYPNEGAGFVLGSIREGAFAVEAVLPLDNRWEAGEQRRRFRLTPQDALKGELEAERLGLSVIGVFHSHPDHPAQPSQWDLEWATWPNFSYLITSVESGKAALTRAWRLRDDRAAFEEDEIQITQPVSEEE